MDSSSAEGGVKKGVPSSEDGVPLGEGGVRRLGSEEGVPLLLSSARKLLSSGKKKRRV